MAAGVTRVVFSDQALDPAAGLIAVAMMLGGMAGAALAARWLARVSENRLQHAVRTLLIGIGVLLIVESVTGWTSTGLSLGMASKAAIGLVASLLIGIVSTLLGVAGGEFIIPTLALVFGVPIKVAGTLSLLISVPTILVGLDRHRARGAFRGLSDLRHLIVPMGLGTIARGIAGGLLVAYVPAGAVKVLLGVVLIASALKVFAVHRGVRQGGSLSS